MLNASCTSSHTLISNSLYPILPHAVIGIVIQYEEERWQKLAQTIAQYVLLGFSKVLGRAPTDEVARKTLQEALEKENFPMADHAILEGAPPAITGKQFVHLLSIQRFRALGFILAQMQFQGNHQGFDEIRNEICTLENANLPKALEIYFRYSFRICLHKAKAFFAKVRETDNSEARKIMNRQVFEAYCSCVVTIPPMPNRNMAVPQRTAKSFGIGAAYHLHMKYGANSSPLGYVGRP